MSDENHQKKRENAPLNSKFKVITQIIPFSLIDMDDICNFLCLYVFVKRKLSIEKIYHFQCDYIDRKEKISDHKYCLLSPK